MEKIIKELRHLEYNEPTNMKGFFELLTVFITSLNIGFALITAENINIITGILGSAFLLMRNIPFVVVRGYEVFLFVFSKKHRMTILGLWRDAAKKSLNDEKKDDDE